MLSGTFNVRGFKIAIVIILSEGIMASKITKQLLFAGKYIQSTKLGLLSSYHL